MVVAIDETALRFATCSTCRSSCALAVSCVDVARSFLASTPAQIVARYRALGAVPRPRADPARREAPGPAGRDEPRALGYME
jgi:hypothetical protein